MHIALNFGRLFVFLICLTQFLLVNNSFGQVNEIGPFDGTLSEGFESFDNYLIAGETDTLVVADGGATFTATDPTGLWITNPNFGATWGLGDYGLAGTNSGEQALGLFDDVTLTDVVVDLEFSMPVSRVGFWYVTAASGNSDMDVALNGVDGSLLASFSLDSLGNEFVWAGWESSELIGSISFSGNIAPAIDDLQATPVPEPGLGILAIFAVCLARRNRKS